MKRNDYLKTLSKDIVKVFAYLYMNGDKIKAKKVLDAQKEIR